jgi:hypothetical protein
MAKDYKAEYDKLVEFLKGLVAESQEFETYDDNMDNVVCKLIELGEIDG